MDGTAPTATVPTRMELTETDVLVVGYGPVGAVLAGLLAARGVSVAVVDRDHDIFPLPRAAHIDHEIMRVFQELGIIDDIAHAVRPNKGMDFLTADRRVLLSMRGGVSETGEARTPSGHPASNMMVQPEVDRAIRRRTEELGAQVHLGVEISGISQDAEGVTARTSDGRLLRARWLVACDGARSTVRKLMGATMHDLEFEEPWLVLDLVLAEGTVPPSDVALQVCDPARPHTIVPMPEPRVRLEFMLLPGEDPALVQTESVVRELLSSWIDPDSARIERAAVYTFHGLIATQWRFDRVLLAGDAAHQMPPFLGQGMCSGIRDAANLAWKLASIVDRGDDELTPATAALLDTYQAEREPHVRAIVELAVGFGRMICTTDHDAAAARDVAMLAARESGGQTASDAGPPVSPLGAGPLVGDGGGGLARQVIVAGRRLDDLVGPRWAVITRSALLLDDAAAKDWAAAGAVLLSADTVPELAGVLEAQGDADTVVVRPDRYVFAAGPSCPAVPPVLAALLTPRR